LTWSPEAYKPTIVGTDPLSDVIVVSIIADNRSTDITWNSPDCPQDCGRGHPDNQLALAKVGTDVLDAKYCCGTWNGSTCEYGPTEGFFIGSGAWINNRTDGSTGPNQTQIITIPDSNASNSSASTTTTTDDSLPVGLGVGLPLGLLLIASLVYVWYLRRSIGRLRRQIKESSYGDTVQDRSAPSERRQADVTALNGVSQPPAASSEGYEMRGIRQAAAPKHYEIRGVPMSELEGRDLLQ
jgi:hypothetical protein